MYINYSYLYVLYYLGLEPRANEVPLRFLVKQLLVEKNRVIFTGKMDMYVTMYLAANKV